MIIPVRCFTCGKVIGNKWETYLSLLRADFSEGWVTDWPTMNNLNSLYKYCSTLTSSLLNKTNSDLPHPKAIQLVSARKLENHRLSNGNDHFPLYDMHQHPHHSKMHFFETQLGSICYLLLSPFFFQRNFLSLLSSYLPSSGYHYRDHDDEYGLLSYQRCTGRTRPT